MLPPEAAIARHFSPAHLFSGGNEISRGRLRNPLDVFDLAQGSACVLRSSAGAAPTGVLRSSAPTCVTCVAFSIGCTAASSVVSVLGTLSPSPLLLGLEVLDLRLGQYLDKFATMPRLIASASSALLNGVVLLRVFADGNFMFIESSVSSESSPIGSPSFTCTPGCAILFVVGKNVSFP